MSVDGRQSGMSLKWGKRKRETRKGAVSSCI